MNEKYKLNKEWLDLLLENKDNENASFMLSDNDTRILLTYIEILQNRINKTTEYIKERFYFNEETGEYALLHTFDKCNVKELLDILNEVSE